MDEHQSSDLAPAKSKLSARMKKGIPSSYSPWIVLFLIALIALYWLFFYHPKTAPTVKPLPVVSAITSSRDVPIYLLALGNVTPTYSVSVRTQINGQLFKVLFKEGQWVRKGDLLAQVDPRPYEALMTQYLGDLERDTALLMNAKMDLKRYQKLWKQDSISQQTLATQLALVKQFEGAVKADEGLIEGTRINLVYCRITSPINGRIGLRYVDPGNIVQTTDANGIAVVNTVNPITVIFTLPEDSVPQVMPQIYGNKKLFVEAYNRNQTQLLDTGELYTVDNQINPATGTYKLRAHFNNTQHKLFPNQFVNIKVLVDTLHQATIVPTSALQHTTSGTFVYVVNKDNTVSATDVLIGPVDGEDTVITKGIAPGQSVIVAGADKLSNGAKVSVVPNAKLLASHTVKLPYADMRSIT